MASTDIQKALDGLTHGGSFDAVAALVLQPPFDAVEKMQLFEHLIGMSSPFHARTRLKIFKGLGPEIVNPDNNLEISERIMLADMMVNRIDREPPVGQAVLIQVLGAAVSCYKVSGLDMDKREQYSRKIAKRLVLKNKKCNLGEVARNTLDDILNSDKAVVSETYKINTRRRYAGYL